MDRRVTGLDPAGYLLDVQEEGRREAGAHGSSLANTWADQGVVTQSASRGGAAGPGLRAWHELGRDRALSWQVRSMSRNSKGAIFYGGAWRGRS